MTIETSRLPTEAAAESVADSVADAVAGSISSSTPDSMAATLTRVFAADGPLARSIPGYRRRPQQLDMAVQVAGAIRERKVLIAEAGTGTGKTFAYLVPALLSGAKVIVSTGTKTLQDQLFNKDLPTVRAALGAPISVALLKGRANYLCHHRLERALASGRLPTRDATRDLRAIARFIKMTKTGDRAELASVAEDSPAWSMVTSTRDNCLGSQCPQFRECFVMHARREALAADLVVVNHHLFFADVMLRDEGLGELLPNCNAVVFDEAHQLPDIASLFFGESVSTGQIIQLVRDLQAEAATSARDFPELDQSLPPLERAVRELRLIAGNEPGRLPAQRLLERDGFERALDELAAALAHTAALLATQVKRSEGLASASARIQGLGERLAGWRDADTEGIRWGEILSASFTLHVTPLSVADLFRQQIDDGARGWVFTSATLAVGEGFKHFIDSLGLTDPVAPLSRRWESPFDFASQALLYVPASMPDPNSAGFAEALVEAAWPLLRASNGRAFVLCTSLRAMRRVHGLIADRVAGAGLDLPLLLQGESAKSELLARFRASGNAILVGSQSFWEGVDVRGDALQLVVIDRLPFAPPDDPVMAARIEHWRRQGRNPFFDIQLPQAVIQMKQGAGRLIRDEADRGVLMVADTRLVDKPYGKVIWRSLPPMRRTRDQATASTFLSKLRAATSEVCAG